MEEFYERTIMAFMEALPNGVWDLPKGRVEEFASLVEANSWEAWNFPLWIKVDGSVGMGHDMAPIYIYGAVGGINEGRLDRGFLHALLRVLQE